MVLRRLSMLSEINVSVVQCSETCLGRCLSMMWLGGAGDRQSTWTGVLGASEVHVQSTKLSSDRRYGWRGAKAVSKTDKELRSVYERV